MAPQIGQPHDVGLGETANENPHTAQAVRILTRLEDYCSTKFFVSGAVDEFVTNHMHLFFERESHERPLDCHAKFLDYQKLIDRLLSEFVQEEAVPTEEIAGFCKLLVEACDDSPTPLMCVDYILAALDYVKSNS
eukprot:GEMP01088735.1.p1 GENE.GEMP01088735.1~~GEMP01088735.1.p1  ORF type:complete len:135 (+),score=26.53 GEMP01088735.1:35-439(+)